MRQEAVELAERLESLTVVVKTKAGEGGKLFGSVNNKDVADALAAQHKIILDKKKLVVKEPIKQVGRYIVPAKLYPEVQAGIKIEVVGE
ncbi:MAG: 50S ribosomal protein L9 [Firmicutes bacterium ADurb.Bin456]|nr:MAG: 50S ribosomal protein L9 [Firmicutes bacterium ADurb.Bin456]